MVKPDPKGTTTGPAGPASDKAHIVNKNAIEQKVLDGPGSLDVATLALPANPDARRWLAKRGFELFVPEAWRFMGLPFDGRGVAFNHSGTADGHIFELTTWRLADDTPLESFTKAHVEEGAELVRLGRLASYSIARLGDAEGVLFVGWGPDDAAAAQSADPEKLYLATDGTNRRTLSWRGAVVRGGEAQLIIVSMSSPIDAFYVARPAFDAMLAKLRIMG
jgi:hypothetical protein